MSSLWIKIFLLASFVSLFTIGLMGQSGKSEIGTLIVRFNNVSSDEGVVKVALCNSEENYDDHYSPFFGKDIEIINGKSEIKIEDIPFGEYAVKAFHDEDKDGDLNTNFIGIPTEDYGFSNNASDMFGPPDWDEAKFQFNSDNQVIEITLD